MIAVGLTVEHPLKTWRRANEMSQADVARLLVCQQALVSKIELGQRRPSGRVARRIDEVTGGYISRHWLRPDIFGVPPAVATRDGRSNDEVEAA